MKNPITKWLNSGSDYSAVVKLAFIGVGLYVLFFPITIPMSIYQALTEKPYTPPDPIQETEEQKLKREANASRFKFRKDQQK